MERTLRCLTGTTSRVLQVVVTLAVASSLASAPATAGLRDMVKSAKDKATQKTAGKSGSSAATCDKVEFNDTVIELTVERLDKFIAGLKYADAPRAEQGKLIIQRDELNTQISALREKHGSAIDESHNKQEKNEQCFSNAVKHVHHARMAAEPQKLMANPAAARKMLELSARLNDAQLKGDKTAADKAQHELEAMMGPNHADSLAARQECGPLPALHPQAIRLEALEKEGAEIDERIRDLDMKALKLLSDASGMTQQQFGVARERIESYLASGRMCLTPDEREALASRKDALKAALGA